MKKQHCTVGSDHLRDAGGASHVSGRFSAALSLGAAAQTGGIEGSTEQDGSAIDMTFSREWFSKVVETPMVR